MVKKKSKELDLSYSEIFESLPDGILVLDKDFVVTSINHSAQNIFKVSKKKATGKPSRNFLPESLEAIAKRALIEERTVFGDEINAQLRGDERVYIQGVATPYIAQHGQLLGVILQVKNLTSTKFLSNSTTQKMASIGFENLIMGLAHELKNPLSGIRGAAQLLASLTESDETEKCAEIIINEADRLKDLLEKLKHLEPFAEEVMEPCNLHEILMEIVYLESMSGLYPNIKFTQNYDITLPAIKADKNALKQVFLNLVKNAEESGRGDGNIEIATRLSTEHKLRGHKTLSVDIIDQGPGISPETLEKIFSPFYTTKEQGTGLGLFLASQIIAKHGGSIQVESELGKGTIFHVYLPIHSAE